jgi:hypothetical protein
LGLKIDKKVKWKIFCKGTEEEYRVQDGGGILQEIKERVEARIFRIKSTIGLELR